MESKRRIPLSSNKNCTYYTTGEPAWRLSELLEEAHFSFYAAVAGKREGRKRIP